MTSPEQFWQRPGPRQPSKTTVLPLTENGFLQPAPLHSCGTTSVTRVTDEVNTRSLTSNERERGKPKPPTSRPSQEHRGQQNTSPSSPDRLAACGTNEENTGCFLTRSNTEEVNSLSFWLFRKTRVNLEEGLLTSQSTIQTPTGFTQAERKRYSGPDVSAVLWASAPNPQVCIRESCSPKATALGVGTPGRA